MSDTDLFCELTGCYSGFYLDKPVGNNAFSFDSRRNKRIYVPPLIQGSLEEVCAGEEIVFSEMCDGQERNCFGLKDFVYWSREGKDIYIFDNHNHAFAFWAFGLKAGSIDPSAVLVHVDQHKDTRQPERYLDAHFWDKASLQEICEYVQKGLNVGNFLDAAMQAGMFQEVVTIDHEKAFGQALPLPCVADIDLDVFAPEMDYISVERRLEYCRNLINNSGFVTIATSPYFMEQARAIGVLRKLFNFPEQA